MGFFSKLSNVHLRDLPISGQDLVFITYPAALSFLPFTRFWLAIFFVMMVLIGIDSQFGIVDMMSYIILDFNLTFMKKPIREEVVRLILCIILALFGLIFSTRRGFEYLSLVNGYVIVLPLAFINFINYYIFCRLIRQRGLRPRDF